ncbi:ferric reductase-like transmembrane domain-containing protein [Paenibacillus kobensis]|uniref:ferric reductase-like transmembrane domain-containing protein n=1 Tax=Paenibacillus kobensis TaxID=59841 RepID=UPI000FDBD6BE|nr:ferric reductase-like transmembrane domain-containing protein [Paenibacillus kobensis]
MIEWIVNWPTWDMTRVFGIAAYGMIWAGLILGALYRYPVFKGKRKANLFKWHTFLTNGGAVIALAHASVLLIDAYYPYSWRDILVPFAAAKQPVWNGLGTIAMYGVLVLLLTSDFRHKMRKPVWLAIHLTAYPVFVAAAAHGYWDGTDSGNPAMQALYALSLLSVIGLYAVRSVFSSRAEPQRKRVTTQKTG